VIDAYSRLLVGWQLATHLRTDLALDALEMAIWRRQGTGSDLDGLIHHSDRGGQTGLKGSSQHPDRGVSDGVWQPAEAGPGVSGADPVAGTPERRVA
jgi:transposase InsO family protein